MITHEQSEILKTSEYISTVSTPHQSPNQKKVVEQKYKTKDSLKTFQDHRTSLLAHLKLNNPDFPEIKKQEGILKIKK